MADDPKYVTFKVIDERKDLIIAVTGTRRRGLGYRPVERVVDREFKNLYFNYNIRFKIVIVHGGADGVDSLCEYMAKESGWRTEVEEAEWDKYGKPAGMIRNRLILDKWKPKFLLAFPDDESIGTWGMVKEARIRKIDYKVCFFDG
jgi:hypothetical protein